MKVKNLNANSKKTKDTIRNNFIELLYENGELQNVSVTELSKRAGITRSSFYNHYDSIYDVAKELQDDLMALLINDDIKINSLDDINDYIDMLTKNIKENENTYRMILASNEQILFFEKIRNIFVNKACDTLKDIKKDKFLELKMSFFIDGVMSQIIKYFRLKKYYSIDELNINIKEWFKKLFY